MNRIYYLSTSTIVALTMFPIVAFASDQLCYMRLKDGRVMNLGHLCGTSSTSAPRSSGFERTPVAPAKQKPLQFTDVRIVAANGQGLREGNRLLEGKVTNMSQETMNINLLRYTISYNDGIKNQTVVSGLFRPKDDTLSPGQTALFAYDFAYNEERMLQKYMISSLLIQISQP